MTATAMPDGDGPMPTAWQRPPDTLPLTVHYRDSRIPHPPEPAFADEFTSSLGVFGDTHVDL
jgi:hypothetical protein